MGRSWSQDGLTRLGLWMLLLLIGGGCYPRPAQSPIYYPNRGYPPPGGMRAPYQTPARRSQITVTPAESFGSVGSTQILVATVTDEYGNPLHGQEVNWLIEEGGVGKIVSVDSRSRFMGAPSTSGTYAKSYSSPQSCRLGMGTPDPADDVTLKAGQTWVAISSTLEGMTTLSAYASSVNNYDQNRTRATVTWTGASWEFPPDATVPMGREHVLEARVFRRSTNEPLPDYGVLFRIVDGVASNFTPGGGEQYSAVTDQNGVARAVITQDTPLAGSTIVEMEITRPGAGGQPSVLARGDTQITWAGPQIGVSINGPETAAMGQEIEYLLTVTNSGRENSGDLQLNQTLPFGMTFARASPEPVGAQNGRLTWNITPLTPGASSTVRVFAKVDQTGTLQSCVDLIGLDGVRPNACMDTRVEQARLTAAIRYTGPQNPRVGDRLTFEMVIQNVGTITARNIYVRDAYSEGLRHAEFGQDDLEVPPFDLGPGQSNVLDIEFEATAATTVRNQITVSAEGDIKLIEHADVVINP